MRSATHFNNPTFTIVTPSFNQVMYLEEAILSILRQNYSDLEYFVMDGGSDDGSKDIIEKHGNKITAWVSEADAGQSDAIHSGFQRGRGEILGWINSDDALFPGALAAVAKYFTAHPETDVLLGGLAYADKEGKISRCYAYPQPSLMLAKRGIATFGQQSMFFRRTVYERVGGLKKDFHYLMDRNLFYKFIFSGARIASTRTMIGIFRWHDDMKSINRSGRKTDEILEMQQQYDYSPKTQWFARKIYQSGQILNGNYIYSLLQSMKYENHTIKGIWQ